MMSVMISTDVDLAVERLSRGGLVALPTETVYGLAADARNPEAVARIYEVKGRPSGHPLIVHISDAAQMADWASDVPVAATTLAGTCWPGPLTMLLPRRPDAGELAAGGLPTIGLRSPSHPIAQAVLKGFGSGLAAPSANRFGKVSPTTARHVIDDIGDRLDPERDLVLDGGASAVGVESTIVDLSTDRPQVLRAGAISADDLHRILDHDVGDASGPSRAAGMMTSHYAPDCAVLLADDRIAAEALMSERAAVGGRVELLDRTDDLAVAARELYADLRAADAAGLDALVVVMPPAEGLGHAIRDRLVKASATTPGRSNRAR